jgi:hypothetical protein
MSDRDTTLLLLLLLLPLLVASRLLPDQDIAWVQVCVHKVVRQQHLEESVYPQRHHLSVQGAGAGDVVGNGGAWLKGFHQHIP